MNGPDSRGEALVIADENGQTLIIEPEFDPWANVPQHVREKLLANYARQREAYRRRHAPPSEPGTPSA